MGKLELFSKAHEGASSVYSIQIFSLQVLYYCQLKLHHRIISYSYYRRHLFEPGNLRGTKPTLACNELIFCDNPTVFFFYFYPRDSKRLEHSVLPDGVSKVFKPSLVEIAPRLVRVRA